MKISISRLLLLLCSLGLVIPVVHAQDMHSLKTRIKERLPSLDRLKSSGAVGENLRGFIEVRGGGSDAANVAAAENADREIVYAAIAKKTGSSAETVGRARARKLAENSASGVWIQSDDGSWHKK